MGFNQVLFSIELTKRANREEVFSTRRREGIHHILLLKDKSPHFICANAGEGKAN